MIIVYIFKIFGIFVAVTTEETALYPKDKWFNIQKAIVFNIKKQKYHYFTV